MPILAYDDNPGKVAFSCETVSFPWEQHSIGADGVPDPILGYETNGYISFASQEPGFANVDWGDGNKEQYPFVKSQTGKYILSFRSLNIEWKKNPDVHPWWFYKEDGSEYIPIAPHIYNDGVSEHNISISFTNKVTECYAQRLRMPDWPVIDLPELTFFGMESISFVNQVTSINEDRIGRTMNINALKLSDMNNILIDGFPEAFLKLSKLKSINLGKLCNLSDLEGSRIRNITSLPELTELNLGLCGLPAYIKEFNQLSKLKTLRIASCQGSIDDLGLYNHDTMPQCEVDSINRNLTEFDFEDSYGSIRSKVWKTWFSGKGLQNITRLGWHYCSRMDFTEPLPGYVKEMRSMMIVAIAGAIHTQSRADAFVNAWYDYVTNWSEITMSSNAADGLRNQFYGVKIAAYEVNAGSKRPSGTLQAPSGFSQGQSNGTPTTPMEKIYVLTNNYKQVWILKPEEADTASARVLTAATPYSLSIVEDRVYFGTGDMISPGEVFNFQTPEDAKRFLTSFNYPTEVIDEYVKQQNEGGPA